MGCAQNCEDTACRLNLQLVLPARPQRPGRHGPGRQGPGRHIPGRHIPGRHIQGQRRCGPIHAGRGEGSDKLGNKVAKFGDKWRILE